MEITYTLPRQATPATGMRLLDPDDYWVAPSGAGRGWSWPTSDGEDFEAGIPVVTEPCQDLWALGAVRPACPHLGHLTLLKQARPRDGRGFPGAVRLSASRSEASPRCQGRCSS